MKNLKRYLLFILVLGALFGVYLVNREIGLKGFQMIVSSFKQMLLVLPPIFILLGLLDAWVPQKLMVKWMGEGSGWKGVALALFLGSAAAGPLYGAFPVAAVFMKKGVKYSNILIFIGAWSTTKIPMFLFEITALGSGFALTRLALSLIGIFTIASIVDKLVPSKEKEKIYAQSKSL